MKKKIVTVLLLLGGSILFIQSAPPPSPDDQLIATYEQQPPIPKHYWVQKLQQPLADGSNMTMRIEYEEGVDIPTKLNIYYGDGLDITFHDDGQTPDIKAGDRIYSAYIQEDLQAFTSKLTQLQQTAQQTGSVTAFNGHLGTVVSANNLIQFDQARFDNFEEVEIDAMLINASDCGTSLKKENSLFITDLSVVEDPARTYNVVTGAGNPNGVWTFGNLIKNMAYVSSTGISAKTLLKEWVKGWAYGRTINGQSVPARTDVFRFLIGPWLQKANPSFPANYYGLIGGMGTQWETDWNNTPEADLLKNAPFKLMAIVNRIDLRGNSGYTGGLSNAGETRFIFTLEAPFDFSAVSLAGNPPKGFDGMASGGSCVNPIDWEGMNVIIEYGNPFSTACKLRDYAQKWLDLSGLTLGNSEYNDSLEAITHFVIDSNAAPSKPNKSALDQLRTNERIFFPSACHIAATAAWSASDWELSQFQLDATSHLLKPAPVANTPMNVSNIPWYLTLSGSSSGGTSSSVSSITDPTDHPGSNALLEWTFLNKIRVHAGNHSLPLSYTYAGDQFKLAATAVVDAEQVQYWDLAWYNSNTTHYSNIYNNPSSYPYEKDMRQQLSLNTCQGCHTGETKTVFTMVRPLPYGQAANYWGATPNGADGHFPVDHRGLDTRFASTWGQSNVNGSVENNHDLSSSLQYFTRVSPFLTGRNYSGTGAGTWQDDKHTGSEDASDSDPLLTNASSLFYVYDPTSYNDGTTDQSYPKPDRVEGYNDLQMRKQKLCQFLNADCSGSSVALAVLSVTSHMPLSGE
ncbi:hypothetical protein ACTHGU_20100 [Chitinophagaceae bacterium MMS25-I14]